MKNYEEMSDFEINCEVAKASNWTSKSFAHEIHSGKWNPCQNPSDAWPIIVDNEISINRWVLSDGWGADRFGHFDTRNDNPLRAAMIVFLKMNEDKL